MRVAWTARRLNQSILKELNPEYSLEGLVEELRFHMLCGAIKLKKKKSKIR